MGRFPDEFLWGAMVSSHQVEGGNFHNDWWPWEQRPGRIADGAISKVAADHATRFAGDYELARKLGHNAHLFNIEWSRVEPSQGELDLAAVDHYRQRLRSLHDQGLTPVIAFHHVTLPNWLAERGGWESEEAPQHFARYAGHVFDAARDMCRWWIPILEPMHTVTQGYLDGLWPPQKRSWRSAWRALRHMALAHARVYEHIRAVDGYARVGVHVRARSVDPADDSSAWDLRASRRETHRRTDAFLVGLRHGRWPRSAWLAATAPSNFDFLAFACDPPGTVRFDWRAAHRGCVREVYRADDSMPTKVFRDALEHYAGYGRPLLLAGDGIATDDDDRRCRLLLDRLSATAHALDAAIPVLGYFHRALLDGFEWTHGYTARYGLVHVDRASLARTPNTSAYLYRDIIESREIRAGPAARYAPGWKEM